MNESLSAGKSRSARTDSPEPVVKKSPKTKLLIPKKTLKTSKPFTNDSSISMIVVPPEIEAKVVYEELKISIPEPIEMSRIEKEECSLQRESQRPARKSITLVTDMETESEETEGTTEEEETTEEDDEDFSVTRKKCTSKDDVVHCNCSNNLDEGFMIQVIIKVIGCHMIVM